MTITRTLCPLDCGWHHDQPDFDPAVPQPFATAPPPEGADPIVWGFLLGGTLVVENALKAHLESHELIEWVTALAGARRELADEKARQDAYEESVVGALNERNTRDCRRAGRAEAAIERVRALHIPARGGRSGYNPDDDDTPGAYGHIASACEECGSQDLAVRWPCPTIQALEQP